ncbi:GtrA family protein [Thermostaphylospora chromogena]|uniref:Putative flippase GtrA (Transmembrane translocase of bactoprenol-linked glucose) n=1 Tax=Thermostaphylospora chromogena TaxID=35622 RepID=A0A1H1I5N4_9ACTN|nr:GtrA family protein [Thermostaphylospora chromogena]SDR32678.1 Putative flippase GtrA (transmembrane translocase of bactoprenol-linked glucose) [Thermostaphylospora chromogena]
MADLRRLVKSAVLRIFTRYAIGSVVAGVISEATLLLVYGLGLLGAQAASVLAWACGAVVNYVLNRRWAWGRRGRPKPLRELLPYWLTSVASLGITTWATGQADRLGARLFEAEGPRVAFVGAAFLAVYGLLFIAKFCFFHYFVFADTPRRSAPAPAEAAEADAEERRRRSLSHVPSTTRE